MSKKHEDVFEGKQVSHVASDDYVMQHNRISRAAYIMPVQCRRLTALAMARVRADGSDDLAVKISVGDAVRALELTDAANSYAYIREAARHVVEQAIYLETDDPTERWEFYSWYTFAKYNPSDDTIELQFNPNLRQWIQDFKQAYERLEIAQIAQLKSKYALRIFEILMSFRGEAGKKGNGPGKWFWETTPAELRRLLKVDRHRYKQTSHFQAFVVKRAVKEINDARVGIEVKITPKYRSRYLHTLRFDVRLKTSQASRQVGPNVVSDDDEQRLLDANPEAWEEAQAAAKDELGPANEMKLQARAWELFTARDDLHYPKRPRGRPRKKAAAGGPE